MAASTTARTRATRWSARSARRPASTPSSARPPGSTPPTCRACGATAGGSTRTRCASSTRAGSRSTPRPRRWSRSAARRWRPPGSRSTTCSTAPCRSRRWCSRRSPTTGRSGTSGSGAYALVRRGDAVLLTRISERGFHTGSWTLPGGGVDHGEPPRSAVLRELREECGVDGTVGELVAVHDDHFSGTAPSGRYEDFHAVALAFEVTVDDAAEPRARRARRHHRRRGVGAGRRHRVRRGAGARPGARRRCGAAES